jgi:WD40 repeat protein
MVCDDNFAAASAAIVAVDDYKNVDDCEICGDCYDDGIVSRLQLLSLSCDRLISCFSFCFIPIRVSQPFFIFATGSGDPYGGDPYGSSSSDNSVRIWDVSMQQQVAKLRGHMREVNSVVFDGSGKYLASGEVAEG